MSNCNLVNWLVVTQLLTISIFIFASPGWRSMVFLDYSEKHSGSSPLVKWRLQFFIKLKFNTMIKKNTFFKNHTRVYTDYIFHLFWHRKWFQNRSRKWSQRNWLQTKMYSWLLTWMPLQISLIQKPGLHDQLKTYTTVRYTWQ